MSTFSNYLYAVMTAWTPISAHAYYEKADDTELRYRLISETIADVLSAEQFADEKDRLAVGALMVSIGDAESHWTADVVSCLKGGDGGKAWGPWQTQLKKADVCVSTEAALRLALGMVRDSFRRCSRLSLVDRLSFYTDGRCEKNWQRSRYRVDRAMKWVQAHPLEN